MSFFGVLPEVIRITAPIFIVIAVGFLIRKKNIISGEGVGLLNKLAYNIGLPALVFISITGHSLSDIFNIRIIKVIYLAYAILILLTILINFIVKRSGKTKGAIIVSSFRCNMAFVGFPIILAAYGDLALAKASLVVAFLVPVNIIVTVLIFKFYNRGDEAIEARRLFLSFLKDPMIIAAISGILFSYFELRIPEIIYRSLDIISGMTVAIALLSIGASFNFVHLKNDFKVVSYISFNKLILMPVVVFVLSTFVFKVEAIDRNVMVILFATPLAVAAYIMAKELRSNHQLMASALILTTIVSALTISAWLLIFKLI
ncbi:MAG: AEC family transporter [Actinobacteria bacterium]|nr:AEC family transporter [Actinomycetota bacterium]